MEKRQWVDKILGSMTLEQKIGQLMVFGFAGPFVTPHVRDLITKYNVGGLRISQKFHPGSHFTRMMDKYTQYKKTEVDNPQLTTYDKSPNFDRVTCTQEEYTATLNELRDMAMERQGGVPIHYAFDQEGEGADFLFNQRLFPLPMGITATGDPTLAYKVAKSVGMQARALGANMIHSPVLDINTNIDNPEVSTRAYSDKTDIATKYALESLRGFSEMKIMATGKHFPGRGESTEDAHLVLPIIGLSKDEMFDIHIAPYKAMIDAGLPAVMAAFTAYPGLANEENAQMPGATVKEIITGILRDELGFKGVITTDNIQMGGLLAKYEIGEAAVRCIMAGCDLVLCRIETPVSMHIIKSVENAVKEKRITEKHLDASVERILNMRYDMGLHIDGGKVNPAKASEPFYTDFVKNTAIEAAEKSITVLKNENNILPLKKKTKVLLIEQAHHFHRFINNSYIHPSVLWMEMLKHSENVGAVVINEAYTPEDEAAVLSRLENDDYDVVVATSYNNYRNHISVTPLLEKIKAFGKPMVVVSNSPFEKLGLPAFADASIVCFCLSGRENIKAIADVMYGAIKATAKLDVKLVKDKPANKLFIATIADKLRMETKYGRGIEQNNS